MGIVIGPFDINDWYTMKFIREDVIAMRKLNPDKFRVAISGETAILREFYSREAA